MSSDKLLICTKGKTCRKRGAKRLFCAFERQIEQLGLAKTIKLKKTDCLGKCGDGPAVRVKNGSWYGEVAPSDCLDIIGSLLDKSTVRRLNLNKG